MIPKQSVGNDIKLNSTIIFKEQPTKTYRIDFEKNRVYGYIDGIEAMEQAVYKILSTERYDYLIYSHNYGIELKEQIGKTDKILYAILTQKITEALMQDKRIQKVDEFEFLKENKSLMIKFRVTTNQGNFTAQKVVEI